MKGFYTSGMIPLDLRTLEPVDSVTDAWQDFALETLLHHNGYELLGLELADLWVGYEYVLEERNWIQEYSVDSLILLGACVDESEKVYKFEIDPRNEAAHENFEKLKERYIGRCKEDFPHNEGCCDTYHIDDAEIRFTRSREGVLLSPKYVKVLVDNNAIEFRGSQIEYRSTPDGRLNRVLRDDYKYLEPDYPYDFDDDDVWWRLSMGLPPDNDCLFDIDND